MPRTLFAAGRIPARNATRTPETPAMYALELTASDTFSAMQYDCPVIYRHAGTFSTLAEAEAKAEALCERPSTIAVRVWHLAGTDDAPVVVQEFDGFHS